MGSPYWIFDLRYHSVACIAEERVSVWLSLFAVISLCCSCRLFSILLSNNTINAQVPWTMWNYLVALYYISTYSGINYRRHLLSAVPRFPELIDNDGNTE